MTAPAPAPAAGIHAPAADERLLTVTVVYAPAPRQIAECALRLPFGATVGDAIAASGLQAVHPEIELMPGSVGVWGRKVPLEHLLRADDRVEIWRPLRVDPKLARRERFGQQGARAAGLFANRRPKAKSGY